MQLHVLGPPCSGQYGTDKAMYVVGLNVSLGQLSEITLAASDIDSRKLPRVWKEYELNKEEFVGF